MLISELGIRYRFQSHYSALFSMRNGAEQLTITLNYYNRVDKYALLALYLLVNGYCRNHKTKRVALVVHEYREEID